MKHFIFFSALILALESINEAGESYYSLSDHKKQRLVKLLLLEFSTEGENTLIKLKREAKQVFSFSEESNGGTEETRTLDPLRDRQVL